MLIYNANKADGEWEFDLKLTEQEVDYLVNLSVSNLLSAGLVSIAEQEEEQEVALPTRGNEHLN